MNTINTFISALGSSSWFNIERTYYYQASTRSPKIYTSGPLTFAKAVTDAYSYGSRITIQNVAQIIYNKISKGLLPNDQQGIYLLLSSQDVSEGSQYGSFCRQYCGYHSHFTAGAPKYTFGFIGNPRNCISSCSIYNRIASPNNDIGVDAMLSVIAHEIVETMSDPYANAWFDAYGEENADKW